MAFASGGTLGTVQNKTSETSTALTTSAAAAAGDLVVLVIAKDNVSTTDGETSEVSSVSDSGSNTWTKAKEFTNGEGAAAAGSTVSVWYSRLTTGISSGGTITANYGSSTVAKALSAWKFTVGANVSVVSSATGAADATTTAGSLALSGLTSKEYLCFRGSAREGAGTSDSFTPTSGFTEISWAGTTGGANGTENIKVQGEFKIATSTGETSNPTDTQSGDWASVFFALEEVSGTTYSASATEAATASDSPSASTSTGAVSTEAVTASDSSSVSGVLSAATEATAAAADSQAADGIFNTTVSESTSADDSVVAANATLAVASEATTATEIPSSTLVKFAGSSEAASASDLISVSGVMMAAASESGAANEQSLASGALNAGATEISSATETQAADQSMSANIAEPANASDYASALRDVYAFVVEMLSALDILSAIRIPKTAGVASGSTKATLSPAGSKAGANRTGVYATLTEKRRL